MQRKHAVLLATIGLLTTISIILIANWIYSRPVTTESMESNEIPHMEIPASNHIPSQGEMQLALIICVLLYGIFLVLLGIEYFTDKGRKQRAPPPKTEEPKEKSNEQLEDLEEISEKEAPTGAPKSWEEEEFE